MRKKNLCLSGVWISVAACPASAEPLALDFTLAPSSPKQNTLPVTVGVTATVDTGFTFGEITASDSDTQTSAVSGNALANLDFTFAPDGSVAALNTLEFTGGRVQFDDDLTFNLSFALSVAGHRSTPPAWPGSS